jgi:adenosylmethionine-8-amino-7-oxononanoate aminotransferase
MFAFEYADISPDFVCVAKGLTAGFLPMSAVMLRDEMYDLFYDDYESGKSFLHSHTHSGNALGAAVALEVFNIFQEEKIVDHVQALNKIMQEAFEDIQYNTQKIKNIRSIGAVVAADLCYDNTKRMGFEVYQNAVKLGALLRPIGNTIYWVPPLNISNHTLQKLKSITERAIDLSF